MATTISYETKDEDLVTKEAVEYRIEKLREKLKLNTVAKKSLIINRIIDCQNRLEMEFGVAKIRVPEIKKGIEVGVQLTDADTYDTSLKLWGDSRKSILATAIAK